MHLNYQTKKVIFLFILSILFMNLQMIEGQTKSDPLKVGIIGLSHSHVHLLLRRPDIGDIKIVGIAEPNRDLAQRYSDQYGYPMDMVYNTMKEMIAASKPEAVTVFSSIYNHLSVVETCAPLGIHVMVEKPLAVNMKHAKKMESLAKKYTIHLLTNYETTWYPTHHKAFAMVNDGNIGDLRKIVVNDGHRGPIEIGVNQEFLDWLTDPVKNGGGAVTDFGCYGANLITWLNKGEKPEAVMAITQTIKPEMYPKVDDEATIVLQYPKMQGIIQASWNWPMSRKDIEVYGKHGYIYCKNHEDISYRLNEKESEFSKTLKDRPAPYNDPFSFFAAVVNNEIKLAPYDLSSLENNLIVVEILDAAKKSAKSGRKVKLKK